MAKIKLALVGYGRIGKRHAELIFNHNELQLVAICDLEETSIEGVTYYGSLEALIQKGKDIEVLCIATPNGLHEEMAIKALKAGMHVLIEKPMALNKQGCERILFEALNQQKQVFCVMQNRYSPPSVWLKQLMTENVLGNIYQVQINCYWNRDERYYRSGNWHGTKDLDGGTLFTQFSHFIDIMYWLFGDITHIQASMCSHSHHEVTDFEDSGNIFFDFVNGGKGSFNFSTSCWDTNLESSLTIIAEKGSVKVGGQYMNTVEYCHIKDYEMPGLPVSGPPNDYGAYKGSAANHHHIFQNIADVLRGRAPITTNALEGMKVVEIIERMYRAANYIKN